MMRKSFSNFEMALLEERLTTVTPRLPATGECGGGAGNGRGKVVRVLMKWDN